MLEATDYVVLDIVLPFIVVIVDEHCSLHKTADIAQVISAYTDMVRLLHHKYMNPGWSEVELGFLQNMISFFKAFSFQTLGKYQPYQMGTQKLHASDHICDGIREVGMFLSSCGAF